MKNIEIKTTQNVLLEYELADVRDRVVAYLIDIACILISIGILSTLTGLAGSDIAREILAVFLFCIFIFYALVMEWLNHGQSVGKMAMHIQVIKTTGGHAVFADYAARWVFRMIDIYFSLGGIASLLIASSARAQRIGDIVANTTVIKLAPRTNLKLDDLLTIHSQDSYTPSYPQAKMLAEEEVLLIKSTLDRYRKYNNAAHREALHMLASRIMEVLGIDDAPKDRKAFLQTILKDYIVLTR